MATHELHGADAVPCTERPDVCRGASRAADTSGVEPERALDEEDVVVDRLGQADHGDPHAAPRGLLVDRFRTTKGPVSSDREQDVDSPFLEHIDHS